MLSAYPCDRWGLPIYTTDPGNLIKSLRMNGFDATAKASSLIKLGAKPTTNICSDDIQLENPIYLPMDPSMKVKDRLKLIRIIKNNIC